MNEAAVNWSLVIIGFFFSLCNVVFRSRSACRPSRDRDQREGTGQTSQGGQTSSTEPPTAAQQVGEDGPGVGLQRAGNPKVSHSSDHRGCSITDSRSGLDGDILRPHWVVSGRMDSYCSNWVQRQSAAGVGSVWLASQVWLFLMTACGSLPEKKSLCRNKMNV